MSAGELVTAELTLREEGWRVFVLPRNVDSAATFFEAALDCLQLDPPLSGRVHWDAFNDSLYGGMDELREPRIALVWPKASLLADLEPEVYEVATAVLRDVGHALADPEATGADQTKQLVTLIGR